MTNAHPKAIIFDLYGVLAVNGWQAFKVSHFADRAATWAELFELGRKVDAGLASYDDLVRFAAEQTGESQATVRHQLEHSVANDQLLAYIQADLKPHYKTGILSNAGSDAPLYIFTTEERDLFDAIVLSYQVGFIKPQVEMYETIADELGVAVGECVFVDDQERHADGAREAGMQTILYQDFDQFRTELTVLLGP